MDKKLIRKELIKKRSDLSKEEFYDKSDCILNKVLNNPYYQKAKTIGVYVSFKSEVDTRKLINKAFKNKNVCIPKTNKEEMDFFYITSLDQTSKGNFGVLEPTTNNITEVEDIDLLIIPLVGYDDSNNRIGYGKGYYDKYLKRYKGYKLGLAFCLQKTDKIETDKYDVALDEIINEI